MFGRSTALSLQHSKGEWCRVRGHSHVRRRSTVQQLRMMIKITNNHSCIGIRIRGYAFKLTGQHIAQALVFSPPWKLDQHNAGPILAETICESKFTVPIHHQTILRDSLTYVKNRGNDCSIQTLLAVMSCCAPSDSKHNRHDVFWVGQK